MRRDTKGDISMKYVPPVLTEEENRIIVEPASESLIDEIMALISNKTGVSITNGGHYIKIDQTIVPVGDFGLAYNGYANYGTGGIYIHLNNASGYAFAHELCHLVQMVTERTDLGAWIEVPAAIGELWVLEYFRLRTELLLGYDWRLSVSGKMLASLLMVGLPLDEAKSQTMLRYGILPIPADSMVGSYADPDNWERALTGHRCRFLSWGEWPRGKALAPLVNNGLVDSP